MHEITSTVSLDHHNITTPFFLKKSKGCQRLLLNDANLCKLIIIMILIIYTSNVRFIETAVIKCNESTAPRGGFVLVQT
ncbi:MAG: spore maturation protein SpmA [Colwellia sp.]|jgi:spore maturation protein SpmA